MPLTRTAQFLLSVGAVALVLLVATLVWKALPMAVSSQTATYGLILLGPAMGLSAHVSIIGVAILSVPVVLLVWRAMGWKSYRWAVSGIAIAYWLVIGAFFSIGAIAA